jgi:hypothetical protein
MRKEETMPKTLQTSPAPKSSGQVREVPISQEVLKRTAAQELSDPPKFPILK